MLMIYRIEALLPKEILVFRLFIVLLCMIVVNYGLLSLVVIETVLFIPSTNSVSVIIYCLVFILSHFLLSEENPVRRELEKMVFFGTRWVIANSVA